MRTLSWAGWRVLICIRIDRRDAAHVCDLSGIFALFSYIRQNVLAQSVAAVTGNKNENAVRYSGGPRLPYTPHSVC